VRVGKGDRLKALVCVLSFAVLWAANAGDYFSVRPKFHNGGEFPGATGWATCTNGEVALAFDFAGGGHYVSATFDVPDRPTANAVRFEANIPPTTHLTMRLTDGTGQTFQHTLHDVTEGWETVTIPIDGKYWDGGWGGAKDHVFHQPIRGFSLLAESLSQDVPGGEKGVIRMRNVEFLKGAVSPSQKSFPEPLDDVPFVRAVQRATDARDALEDLVPQLEAKGLGAKSRATLSVLDNFFPWLLEDSQRGMSNRVVREAREMAKIGERAVSRARAILAGRERDFPVPKYETGPIAISHAQTIGNRCWPDGHRDRGPVIQTGFGHFANVQRQMHKLLPLGCSIIQMETGPREILTAENEVNSNELDRIQAVLDRAARENVSVTLLLSPHYFPQWAYEKYPDVKSCSGGWQRYCVYNTNACAVIEKYLRIVVPRFAGHPALHSFGLTNEPARDNGGKCPVRQREWPTWLEREYGTLDTMNAAFGTHYASFSEVPKSADGNLHPSLKAAFCRFNRSKFADWHRWMADIVHEMAPDAPVHSKIIINWAMNRDNGSFSSIDPVAFSKLSQFSGNDSHDYYLPFGGWAAHNWWEWAHCWWWTEAGYDLQRSVKDIPVFNSENHIQPDRTTEHYIPGEQTYAVLWQNAIHGQSTTTIWTWERFYDPTGKHEFCGLMLDRPECMEAWAHAALDLSRLADRLAPIQNLPPQILVLHSTTDVAANGPRTFMSVYRAASFLGQALGVITEDMLAEYASAKEAMRPFDKARVVLVPHVNLRIVPSSVREGLARFKARGGTVIDVNLGSERKMHRDFAVMSANWGLSDVPVARNARGIPAFGVETRGYRTKEKSYISLCNHLPAPVEVTVEAAGGDFITGKPVPKTFTVKPLEPMFVVMPIK